MTEADRIMTEQEHYSLRWNNHQNHILCAFDTLLKTKSLVDVTLVCAESKIRAHKVVLSACSPFFQNVFAENPCKHPVIVLKDYSGWVVQAVVDFMYRGEISVPQKQLETLIQVGESLQIRGLGNTYPSPFSIYMPLYSALHSILYRQSQTNKKFPISVFSRIPICTRKVAIYHQNKRLG